ncbi:MAG TPA: DUF2459 domain-containing protein [Chthoniobacterales bacterium]|nr:DUF2459 domain-containing protein [Chthoniobacterales bacterium]
MRKAFAATELALAAVLSGCVGTTSPSAATEPGRNTIYVVHHGTLHTGLTIRRSDIPRGHWPVSADFAGAKYIEVGWGDDDGYRKPLTSGIAMKALMGDPQTVLFAEGFGQTIRRKYRDRKFTVLAIDLSDAGMARLCDHIQQTYALDKNAQTIRLGDGWYRARGTYSAFNTCNTWIARGLRKAGCPINDALCLTAGQLLGRVRPFARDISPERQSATDKNSTRRRFSY